MEGISMTSIIKSERKNNDLKPKPLCETQGGFSISKPERAMSARVSLRRAIGHHSTGFPSCPRGLSIPQILDSFPDEARDMIPKQISRLRKFILPYKKWMEELYNKPYDNFTKWFIIEASLIMEAPIKEIAWLEKLQKMQSIIKRGGKHMGKISAGDILKAKYVPITSLIECKKKGGRYWAKCPFHVDGQERTPSMLINKNNTFKCFSCQIKGDSINFVRKLYGYNFVEAVRMLCQK